MIIRSTKISKSSVLHHKQLPSYFLLSLIKHASTHLCVVSRLSSTPSPIPLASSNDDLLSTMTSSQPGRQDAAPTPWSTRRLSLKGVKNSALDFCRTIKRFCIKNFYTMMASKVGKMLQKSYTMKRALC